MPYPGYRLTGHLQGMMIEEDLLIKEMTKEVRAKFEEMKKKNKIEEEEKKKKEREKQSAINAQRIRRNRRRNIRKKLRKKK